MTKPNLWFMLMMTTLAACWTVAAPDAMAQTGDRVVAVVNQQPITWREWDRRMQMVRARNPGQTLPSDVGQQVLEVLVQERAMVQEALALGIGVSEEEVDNTERAVAQQNNVSVAVLRQQMAQDGLTPQAYRQQLRQQLLLQRVQTQIVEQRVAISEGEITRFLLTRAPRAPERLALQQWLVATPEGATPAQQAQASERAQAMVRAVGQGQPWASLGDAAAANGQAVAQRTNLGWRNRGDWPELFVQAVDSLEPGQVSNVVRSGAGFHVLRLEARAAPGLDLNITLTRARHILRRPSAMQTMPAIMRELAAWRQQVATGQADFAALAQAHSQDGSAAQGGDLGWAEPGQFVPEFEQAMNALPVGGVSQPVVSRFGVHLIQVVQRRQEPMTEAQQRDWARQQLREQRAPMAYNAWAAEVRAKAFVQVLATDLSW